jgi:hypothetical protein
MLVRAFLFFKKEGKMKKIFILTFIVLSFLSASVYGWEIYVTNEGAGSMLDYNESGQLISNIPVGSHQLKQLLERMVICMLKYGA